MSTLAVIALVFCAVIFALAVSVFFIGLGYSMAHHKMKAQYMAYQEPEIQQFVRRLPGQEAGSTEA